MKIFTKIAVGAGIAGAALGAVAMPSNAAPVDNIVSAASERLAGPFVMDLDNTNGNYPGIINVYVDAEGKLKGDISGGIPQQTTFPAVGTTGDVRFADDTCLGAVYNSSESEWFVTVSPCDGSVSQQMSIREYKNQGRFLLYSEAANRPLNAVTASLIVDEQFRFSASRTGAEFFMVDQLTPVAATVVPVDITGPTAGETVPTKNPTFTGTGDEGATVVVKDEAGNQLCTTVVSGGTWSCLSTVDLPDGPHDVTAEQTATDGSTSSDTVSIIVADGAGGPLMDPMIAGGAGVLLLALAGVAVARRRTAATQL